jgi:hypothetical protein
MNWLNIAFYILLGLWFLGLLTFPQMEVVIGIIALVIGIVGLANEVRK